MKNKIKLDGQNNREIYLVRHAERMDFNEKKEWDSGWPKRAASLGLEEKDAPLTEKGYSQARKAAEAINRNVKIIYTSPFLRCVQTAEAISEKLDCDIIRSGDLTEWMNPEWFGVKHYDFFKDNHLSPYPPVFVPGLPKIPESWLETCKRSEAVIDNIKSRDDEFFPVCLVTHGGFIHHVVETLNSVSINTVDYADVHRIIV